jgi:hypothetical protein
VVTVEELQASNPIVDRLAPDLTIDGRGAYSFGIELAAVKGTLR